MTPLGVGVDLIDIARVERLLERHRDRALGRLLTQREREYCMTRAQPARHVAARLAAKEAAFKALYPSSAGPISSWQDFEVERENDGRPSMVFTGRARQTAVGMGVAQALVSLSHSPSHAIAVVILVG